jgi:hypothetical protein
MHLWRICHWRTAKQLTFFHKRYKIIHFSTSLIFLQEIWQKILSWSWIHERKFTISLRFLGIIRADLEFQYGFLKPYGRRYGFLSGFLPFLYSVHKLNCGNGQGLREFVEIEISKQSCRGDWIARRKTLQTFVWILSKNSDSGLATLSTNLSVRNHNKDHPCSSLQISYSAVSGILYQIRIWKRNRYMFVPMLAGEGGDSNFLRWSERKCSVRTWVYLLLQSLYSYI